MIALALRILRVPRQFAPDQASDNHFALGFSVELNFGGTISATTREFADGTCADAAPTLLLGWVGPAIRYAFINESALVPFVGGGGSVYGIDKCRTGGSRCDLDAAFGVNVSLERFTP